MFGTVQLCKRAKEVVKPGEKARYDGPGRGHFCQCQVE